MGSPVRWAAAALLFISLLVLLGGLPVALSQELRERDALCNQDGCFVLYFQRKTFLDSWRACKDTGGNLATVKRQEEADTIAALFSGVELRHSRTKVRVWIGLQRQPRQCTARPLRGFSWTTGDQDTQYTNWLREDSPSTCSAPRCVVTSYSTLSSEQHENFKWLDGSCSVPVDGYLCRYTYKGMCPALPSEGGGNALYSTPFNLLSSLLTHAPFGSVATVPCPAGTKDQQSVLCRLLDDGSVGWSRDSPLCSDPPEPKDWCAEDHGGCEHFCRQVGPHYYCECSDGFQLGEDGQSCELVDVCQGAPCEFECLPLHDGYRCACPEGYMLAPDERGCVDVDECLQSPCEHLCVNAPGTFECRCHEGYRLEEMGGCEDVDECMNDPCEHACENTPGAHICHCHMGFSPLPEDPSRCQDTDECQIPGTCEQMCVNHDGGFECHCEVGYVLMSDQFSCRKLGEGEVPPAVTPSFAWVTRHPGPVWDPEDSVYHWPHQQSHTDWTPEEDDSLDWLTDPPRVSGSDVIWVTSAPQEEPHFQPDLDAFSEGPEEDVYEEKVRSEGDQQFPDWLDLADRAHPDEVAVTTPEYSATTESLPPFDSSEYEDEHEVTTITAAPTTSTISGGAWNWLWLSSIPVGGEPGSKQPEQPITEENTPSYYDTDDYEGGDNSDPTQVPPYEEVEMEREFPTERESTVTPEEATPSQPPQPTPTPSLGMDVEVGEVEDPGQDQREQKQGTSWLLVGLLVPLCIFVVVLVALGIVYCTRCAVQPRNKNTTYCYHWISGAHDKQGTPNPTSGIKSHV